MESGNVRLSLVKETRSMSAANIDAAFEFVTHTLSREEQHVLVQRILKLNGAAKGADELIELDIPNDAETMRRQREALDRVRGIFEGPEDLALRHDEYLYGQGKP
jgi:hypothetical protein